MSEQHGSAEPESDDDVEYGCEASTYAFSYSGEHTCYCARDLGHPERHWCDECGLAWSDQRSKPAEVESSA